MCWKAAYARPTTGASHRAVDRRHHGGHLWSERYDRPLKDIFALQEEIVQKIVTTLKLQLTLREQGVRRAQTHGQPGSL